MINTVQIMIIITNHFRFHTSRYTVLSGKLEKRQYSLMVNIMHFESHLYRLPDMCPCISYKSPWASVFSSVKWWAWFLHHNVVVRIKDMNALKPLAYGQVLAEPNIEQLPVWQLTNVEEALIELTLVFIKVFTIFGTNGSFTLNQIFVFFFPFSFFYACSLNLQFMDYIALFTLLIIFRWTCSDC